MFFRFMVCLQSPVTLGIVLNLYWVFLHYFRSFDSDAGRDWGQEEKGATEDEMAGSHHGLDGRESE